MDFRYKCPKLKVENKNLEGFILKTKCQQFEFKSVKEFEPRSHFISTLIMIFRVNVVLNSNVIDSDWRFDNLCGSHLLTNYVSKPCIPMF